MAAPDPGRRSVLLVEEGGIGGVTDYTAELGAALARAGWRVEVATGRDHRYPQSPGVVVHGLFPYLRGRRAERIMRRLRLARVVNGAGHLLMHLPAVRIARRCDLIHLQGEEWPPLGAVQTLMLRASGRPIVYTLHNTFDRTTRSYQRSHELIRRCARRLVVHSRYDLDALPRHQAAKTVVIPHGEYTRLARRGDADADADASRAALGLDAAAIVVLLFGQLRPDKGIDVLLEAARDVPEVHVVLAGKDEGALDAVAPLLADARLAGRVTVREGFVPLEDVGTLFAAADVVALPYVRASASGVLLLAYGHARPVVAFPVGGLGEYVVDGETGWLCGEASAPSLVASLRDVAAAGRETCRARGEAALRFSDERFDWDVIARQTTDVYEAVMAGR